jgi:hypothetical protein
MTIDLLARYEAILIRLLHRVEDHHERADLCARVLEGETWEQVLGDQGRKPCTYHLLVALRGLDESIQKEDTRQELNGMIERLRETMRKLSLERDRVAKETEPLNLPIQQISVQGPSVLAGGAARPLGAQIRIPVRLVKCHIPISATFPGNQLFDARQK